jgi:hypothetical protein
MDDEKTNEPINITLEVQDCHIGQTDDNKGADNG